MKYYAIGGLGADKRVFKYLNLTDDIEVLDWLEPSQSESFKAYVLRFSKLISLDEEFVLIGVSFGGVLAVELNKILNPKAIILISSVITYNQLPTLLVKLGKLGILKIIPFRYFKPPIFLMNYLFGAENKPLLKEIISDTKPTLIQWSLTQMIHWQNISSPCNLLRIHGTNDRLIPLKGEAVKINKGGHFMIVDKAGEISKIINDWVKFYFIFTILFFLKIVMN